MFQIHVDEHGKGHVPIYRLDAAAKDKFFNWITNNIKFTDGYASNLHNCVDKSEEKFINIKSHDCHVMMQRLLAFVFLDYCYEIFMKQLQISYILTNLILIFYIW